LFAMNPDQIFELCEFSFVADREARIDLAGGYIRDEDDYTSNFTGAFRRIVNANSRTGLIANSYMLSTTDERKFGCDAVFVVESNGYIKIALFEAKLPRFSTLNKRWDSIQESTGLSHFSDQLARQANYAADIAVFEMFYCESKFGKQPQYLENDVSSCVWHREAHSFDLSRTNPTGTWSTSELIALLQKVGGKTISSILKDVCNCTEGKPMIRPADFRQLAKELNVSGQITYLTTG
jgi:hypothetical protein